MDLCNAENKKAIINRLGPDPFNMGEQDRPRLIETMKRSTRPIKEILLDQSIIVGVGNIYASEALFLAGIDPQRRGTVILETEYKKLINAIIEVLELAYKNCGTSRTTWMEQAKKGDNLQFLKVFQRVGKACFQCKTLILRIKQSGRFNVFFAEKPASSSCLMVASRLLFLLSKPPMSKDFTHLHLHTQYSFLDGAIRIKDLVKRG